MTPTVDAFHALARSSPWRWSTLHFTHRAAGLPASLGGQLEAWLTRPDGIRLQDADGCPISPSLATHRHDGRPTRPWRAPVPTYRPDGLVAERHGPGPGDRDGIGDDLFWNTYSWVAMLDPVELSHHVDVADLREDEVHGRPVWRADLTAVTGYDPRCGGNCCELLWSEVGRVCEFPSDPSEAPRARPGTVYPDHYDVALDVQTGVVVRCHPVGEHSGAPWLEVDIHEVDADLDHLFPAIG